jgi:hypothetical protein
MSLVYRCAVCDAPNPAGSHCKGTWCPRERGIRKEHIRKDQFDPSDPMHFRLQSRGGAWRYYRRVDAPRIIGVDLGKPGGDVSVLVTRRGDEIISIERLN